MFACPRRSRAACRLPGAPIGDGCEIIGRGTQNAPVLIQPAIASAAKSDEEGSASDACGQQRADSKFCVGFRHNVGDKFTRKRGTRELLAQFGD